MNQRLLKFAPAVVIAAWFLYFARGGLSAALSGDDLMNIHGYLLKPWPTLFLDNLRFWSTAYRPLGALFYVPLYESFGLNPLPYRVVCFVILGVNLILLWRFCLCLTKSHEIAFLATFIASYHAWFVDLYYSAGTIYDLLSYALYLGAFLIYAGIRERGRTPGPRVLIGIAVLYVLALDAKEMAVTFPLLILVYEIIFHTADLRQPIAWLRRNFATIGITGVLTAIYTAGKLKGPGSLVENPAYALTVSPGRYLDTFHLYMNPLFYQEHRFHDSNTIQIVTVMLIIAIALRSRALLFAWFWLLLTLLPVAFIAHYAAFFEYLPAVGWTLYAATLLVSIGRAVVHLLDRAGRPFVLRASQAVLFLCVAGVLAPVQRREAPKTLAHFMSVQPPSREMTADLARLHPALRRGGHVLFVDDPYPKDSYLLLFMTRLFYHDMTVEVVRTQVQPVPATEYSHYDAVFGFQKNRLVLLPNGAQRTLRPVRF